MSETTEEVDQTTTTTTTIDNTHTTESSSPKEDSNEDNNNDNDNENQEESLEELDPELEEMKKKFREMEEEAKKLTELQNNLESNIAANNPNLTMAEQEEVDSRSIYVGNVDYKSTHDQILAYFQSCGTVNRITILTDKATGHPKGCCYVEFVNKDSITNAMALNDSVFNERQIKITPKRTNLPAYMRGFPPGGRGARGGGRGRGMGGAPRGFRGGRGGGRGRGGGAYFHPYQ
ncbi:hypothetical protein CYY_004563 [Polysphondylium violaceum]|uniref:RRM domain-containing protein n=1 Tax=Polysphondylium violaceum TaxID=133409 RepID=A0A8J4PV71_9MYCE|nr:hypothetical protein CYY_004563 [Polysphondylium violaceum]